MEKMCLSVCVRQDELHDDDRHLESAVGSGGGVVGVGGSTCRYLTLNIEQSDERNSEFRSQRKVELMPTDEGRYIPRETQAKRSPGGGERKFREFVHKTIHLRGGGLYESQVDFYMMIPSKKHKAVLKEFSPQEFVKDKEQQEICDFSDFVHDTQAELSYREATTEKLQVLCQCER
ncbi:hypothetical protein INR49_000263 [Caranx melampygus]|nr:hypothetical protein INR49_000263 [Caranx melampygus]